MNFPNLKIYCKYMITDNKINFATAESTAKRYKKQEKIAF